MEAHHSSERANWTVSRLNHDQQGKKDPCQGISELNKTLNGPYQGISELNKTLNGPYQGISELNKTLNGPYQGSKCLTERLLEPRVPSLDAPLRWTSAST